VYIKRFTPTGESAFPLNNLDQTLTREDIISPCPHTHKLIRSLGAFSITQQLSCTMCYQDDIYHSQCGHWGKRVYSKCANSAASKWANGCWERTTTGSAREDSQCSACRSGRTDLTAGKSSTTLIARLGSKSIIVPLQAVDAGQLLQRRTGDPEFLGHRPLHQ
jgi:hypothetical protein